MGAIWDPRWRRLRLRSARLRPQPIPPEPPPAGHPYVARQLARSGLHRYWRMGDAPGPFADSSGNESAMNSSGSGEIRSAPSLLAEDEEGAAEWFSGTPYAAAEANLDGITDQWSIELLFQTSTNNRLLLRWGDDWQAAMTTGGLIYFRPGPSSTPDIRYSSAVDDGAIHHLALSCDGSDVQIFIDGNAGGEMAIPGFLPTYMTVGRGASSFVGIFDEISAYSRALSSSEIAGDAEAAKGEA